MRRRRPRRSSAAAALVASGMAELAAGALSGWVYTLAKTQPDAAKRIGLKSTPRVRQWHLDLAMLGTAAVAAGPAGPPPPPGPAPPPSRRARRSPTRRPARRFRSRSGAGRTR